MTDKRYVLTNPAGDAKVELPLREGTVGPAAVEIGAEGMRRLGFAMAADPTQQEAFAPLMLNQTTLAHMSFDDHIRLAAITDPKALAAARLNTRPAP